MNTAEQILEAKGYDPSEINDIICVGMGEIGEDNSLDMQTREEFGLSEEPLHLWESYTVGDADEEVLEAKAKELKCEDISELLIKMDKYLCSLCNAIPEKLQEEEENA